MGLATSVDEDKWVLQRDGSRVERSVSAIPGASQTIVWQVTSQEYKYFAITITAAQAYMASHPTLDLDIEVVNTPATACHILKRVESRSITEIIYA